MVLWLSRSPRSLASISRVPDGPTITSFDPLFAINKEASDWPGSGADAGRRFRIQADDWMHDLPLLVKETWSRR